MFKYVQTHFEWQHSMKDIITQMVVEYLPRILEFICVFLVAYISKKFKNVADNNVANSLIADTVRYVEQVYKDIHGTEKLNKAAELLKENLKAKGIKIDNYELNQRIEAAVHEMNTTAVTDFIEALKNGDIQNFDADKYLNENVGGDD